ncbi:YbdK family carboxylate-amine ligase [Streptacidiphilus sp. PB12-B1b]|uniref:carboxylate-amine ligase n=1 Tax=Streptacidiphilus sp. PB12-B1b TaxID=2705012 RepID=UPI0015FDB585|nr:YbdK family carboxylate-amine ligase [Streptacidiphilus sp. PB12-B1b]QMU76711.1 YbdK family carboxylate-amine ligase [Streptacidiphilus sp. PB12-B1b]
MADQLRQPLQLGVEEEFLLVDRHTRVSAPRAAEVIADAARVLDGRVQSEFFATQLEICSRPQTSAGALRADLAHARATAARAAAGADCLLVASPAAVLTRHPLPLTGGDRYQRIARHLAPTVRACRAELSGCHIHLGSLDRAQALTLNNHLRPWMPALQALAANSPICDGRDRGCASWRALQYDRWPTVGPAPLLDESGYDALADLLVASGTILDRRMIYWYSRPSEHLPTLEVRVADVNADLDTTVLLAVLLRALATSLLADARAGLPPPPVSEAQLRAAHREAALHGLDGAARDPVTGGRMPMASLLRSLVARGREALRATGDLPLVRTQLARVLAEGNGAQRQRATYRATGSPTAVVDQLAVPATPC